MSDERNRVTVEKAIRTVIESAERPSKSVSDQSDANDFMPAPNGGLDYGEITPEMSKARKGVAGCPGA